VGRALAALAAPSPSPEEADIFLLHGDTPLPRVSAQREHIGSRLMIGYSRGEPSLKVRLDWIRAGAEDVVAEHEVAAAVHRLWEGLRPPDARRLGQFLGEAAAYLEQREQVAAKLGEQGTGQLVDLGRRREVLLQNPVDQGPRFEHGFRWPAQLLSPTCVGSVMRFSADVLTLAAPVMLKARDPIVMHIRAEELEYEVVGEVIRPQGTSGAWWVVSLLVKGIRAL
jgi:hypothetical protein